MGCGWGKGEELRVGRVKSGTGGKVRGGIGLRLGKRGIAQAGKRE